MLSKPERVLLQNAVDERCAAAAVHCQKITQLRALHANRVGGLMRGIGWHMAVVRSHADRIIALRTQQAAGGVL